MLNIKMHVRTEGECAHLGVDPGVIIQAVSPEVDAQRVEGDVAAARVSEDAADKEGGPKGD